MFPMTGALALLLGVLGTATSAAAAPAGVAHHGTCNNDPGYDPSHEPLCRDQHARAGHYGYPHHGTEGRCHRWGECGEDRG
jgi:hypothetical protein